MNQYVKNLLESKMQTVQEKLSELVSLTSDVQFAKEVLEGKYKYCKDCDDYYLSGSFQTCTKTESCEICTYQGIINSGENEYVDGLVDTVYSICPKGHEHVIERVNKRKVR